MNVGQNARLTWHSRASLMRRVLVDQQPRAIVVAAFGVSIRTVAKWGRRFEAEGEAGLIDRSSRHN